ncbi:putative metal-dependent hydrolase [Flavobacterium sp. MAH-1]|uniref:Putative metal-dependent hydrolase n=1 Tax=Flavobacterium agri TaxID=2743471 RepID=A0A7Y8Y4T4_9FLAO|nr:putative metal-dependent hydrolase [Flavobacterium agri]NUY82388.1 putative metal-dependent hydrolase [Flavobacterium agri]NYA72412.1 putative metal-dependent hydrolase [Flavobacterium agri]
MDQDLESLKYPIGPFTIPDSISDVELRKHIITIERFPQRITAATISLSKEQLDTPYRPQGWTIRQVVHHCADSQMNAIIRFKLALTEEKPVIRPYFEDRWAELVDGKFLPIEPSLKILEGVHRKWSILLENLEAPQFERTFVHPEHGAEFSLAVATANYAWHCEHHLAHVTNVQNRNGWR